MCLESQYEEALIVIKQLRAELELAKPLYSRRELEKRLAETEAKLKEVSGAAQDLMDNYLELGESGDCGYWKMEEWPVIIRMRAALAALKEAK